MTLCKMRQIPGLNRAGWQWLYSQLAIHGSFSTEGWMVPTNPVIQVSAGWVGVVCGGRKSNRTQRLHTKIKADLGGGKGKVVLCHGSWLLCFDLTRIKTCPLVIMDAAGQLIEFPHSRHPTTFSTQLYVTKTIEFSSDVVGKHATSVMLTIN